MDEHPRIVAALVASLVSPIFVGCAINTGVVMMDQDTYTIAQQRIALSSEALFPMRTANIGKGIRYCANLGRAFEFLALEETQPPYILGNVPRSELRFKCVAKHAQR
jgi:hypothetical protein